MIFRSKFITERGFLSYVSLHFIFFFSLPFLHAFANNNVRVDQFKWMHYQSDHFDIYYDQSTEVLLPSMIKHLEGAWKDVGDIFHMPVPGRTPFFFYSNHNEFEQTNVVSIGEGTGGVTEAFKNRFLIFNDGSQEWLKHVIYHEFSHVVQFNILFGGFWKSVRLLKSPFYPLWAMEGAAEFGSGDIDNVMGDMVVRDAVAFHKVPSLEELQGFGHLKPNQITLGYKTGEAAMHFFKDEFGLEKWREFFPSLKEFFDVSSALDDVLGCNLQRFDFRFQEWLEDKYESSLSKLKPASSYGSLLTFSDQIPQFNESPVVSKDGRKIYYFSDRKGPSQIWVTDLETRKSQPLIKLKWKSYENMETRGRALSISKDGKYLAFSAEKKQRDCLFLYDLENKKLIRKSIPYDQIRSPIFSPVDENLLVCVGMKRGVNDLYLIDRAGREVKRLTDNQQDERDPVFTKDGLNVIYSGEVIDDHDEGVIERDLFSVDIQTCLLRQITHLKGRETEPAVMPDGSCVFVRDRNDNGEPGFNLFHMNFSAPQLSQGFITDLIGGGFSPVYSEAKNALFFVAFENGEKHIYQGTWSFPLGGDHRMGTAYVEKGPDSSPYAWQRDKNEPRLSLKSRPYRFQGSTDLFIPFFLYSTQDGLLLVDIWQYSDLLGNHQFQQQMQYASGNDLIDLAVAYTYSRFRPQLTLGFRGQKFYRDFQNEDRRKELTGFGVMAYPLDRVSSIQVGIGSTHRKDTFLNSEENNKFEDRFFLAGYDYDTVIGRYLVPTKGNRLNLFYQQGVNTLGGDQFYKTHGMQVVQYIPLHRESTWASRLFFGQSSGPDSQVFRLGGVDRIRAVPSGSESFKKSNVVFGSSELRYRIKYLNARTRFLFPDFFFKAAYLIVFDDIGYGWDTMEERDAFQPRDLINSAGVGISWPTFILQSFQLNLTIQWAKQTTNGNDVWYITVGPTF